MLKTEISYGDALLLWLFWLMYKEREILINQNQAIKTIDRNKRIL